MGNLLILVMHPRSIPVRTFWQVYKSTWVKSFHLYCIPSLVLGEKLHAFSLASQSTCEFSWSSDHIAGQAWLQREGLRREVEGRVETREGKEEEERERVTQTCIGQVWVSDHSYVVSCVSLKWVELNQYKWVCTGGSRWEKYGMSFNRDRSSICDS